MVLAGAVVSILIKKYKHENLMIHKVIQHNKMLNNLHANTKLKPLRDKLLSSFLNFIRAWINGSVFAVTDIFNREIFRVITIFF